MEPDHDPSTMLLSENDIEELITINDVIKSVEQTYSDHANGKVINPTKMDLELGEEGNWPHYEAHVTSMPAYVDWNDSAGLKWIGGFWENQEKGLNTHTALIILIDPETGIFRAVLEGSYITALRTAAQTAVGAKYLDPDISSIGIYGAGVQARYQVLALSESLDIDEIKVYDQDEVLAQQFEKEMSKQVSAEINTPNEAEQAADSDMILTVTTAKAPFVQKEWISNGTLVAALGTYQEIEDEAIMAMDNIIVDHIDQCLNIGVLKNLAARGEIGEDDIDTTIGEIVNNETSQQLNGTNLYVPIGMGALDVATAAETYYKAINEGIGDGFNFSSYKRPETKHT